MALIRDDLPDYENPPVVEVAASIQFAPLSGFTVAHVGSYWDKIRDRLGRVEEQFPMAHVIEHEELRPRSGPPAEILMTRPELARMWFTNEERSQLVQLQTDRFAYNWKKPSKDAQYPRYGKVKEVFWEYWKGFQCFLERQSLPPPSVDQCELTYVNLIAQGEGWKAIRDWETLFSFICWKPRTGFLPDPERVAWSLSFRLPDGEGRLHVDASPVFVPPGNALAARMVLTVRGMPKGEISDDRIIGWFDVARTWIVKGFVDLVTDETDGLWGRRR